jgi:dTDP-4-dehydrorhamnose reductase
VDRQELRDESLHLKILLFGKYGQVGWELQRSLAPLGQIVAPDRNDAALCGDLQELDRLVATVRNVRPDVIVNAAGYTAVDKAESQPELAEVINSSAPGALASEAAASGALLVHYSTDYVFDGSGASFWREDDPTGPLNVYGRTKLKGENLIRASGCQHLILRTGWVYANRGQNFLRTMMKLAAERDSLNVVDDQHGAPTSAELLADVTALAIHTGSRGSGMFGTYHVAASGETTWHRYASHLIGFARAAGCPVRVAAEAIRPVKSSEFAAAAARPQNSRLATEKFRESFGLVLPDWRTGVNRTLMEILGR